MDLITLLCADLFLTAVRKDTPATEENPHPNRNFIVTCTDRLSGKAHTVEMTDEQLCSVVACVVSDSGEGTGDQYEIASKVCEGFPTECRPIP